MARPRFQAFPHQSALNHDALSHIMGHNIAGKIPNARVTDPQVKKDCRNEQNGPNTNWGETETSCPSKGLWVLIFDGYFECFKSNYTEHLEVSSVAMGMRNGSATLERVLTKLSIYSPYDSEILPLGIYPREIKTSAHKKMCT